MAGNLGKITYGRDFNYFKNVSVTSSTFTTTCDVFITFTTASLSFINEGTGGTNSIEYSFNGNTVHGDMIPSTGCATLLFQNRVGSKIWFRLKSGSSGPVTVRVEAWANP